MKECLSELAPLKGRLILKYHKGSERMSMMSMKGEWIDCRLWDVVSPKIAGYVYNEHSGPVTLSIEGMKERGLLQ